MNRKITLSRLISMLAEKSGKDTKICEDILKSFFKQISSALEDGESVKVKGLGTFKVSAVEARKSVDVTSGNENEIPAHSKVVFVPSKELAAAVNAPFEMFETIEIDEEILEEELMTAETEMDQLSAGQYEQQIILEEEKMDNLKSKYPDIEEIIESADNQETPDDDQPADNEEFQEPEPDDNEMSEEVEAVDKNEESGDQAETDVQEKYTERQESYGQEKYAVEATAEDEGTGEDVAADEEEPDRISEDNYEKRTEEYPDEDKESASEDRERVRVRTAKNVRVKSRSSFSHGFIWGMVGALIIFLLGIAALWFVNDEFANWGRGVFAHSSSVKGDDMPKDTVQIVGASDAGEDEVTDGDEAEIAMQENEMSEVEGGVPEMVEDVAPENIVPTKPSDSKITYDTITTTHYLTTMAKKHYGNYHLWPYIYKENEKILGHPNRIRPGTKIVIPDLKKYGVDPNNPKDIEKAKRLGTEIYDRYK